MEKGKNALMLEVDASPPRRRSARLGVAVHLGEGLFA